MRSFRVTTYNIHKCRGLDRRVRPHRIAAVLQETEPDVIALQEVVGMDETDRQRNHLLLIAEELGLDYRIGEARRLNGAAYGNALLTRLPIIASENHDITWRRSEPRGCLDVTIELGHHRKNQRLLRIYNVHLGTGFFERRYQAPKLIEVLGEHSDHQFPRVVLGDFNEWPRGLASKLLELHFNTAEPRRRLGRPRSYPGILPLTHVDHIYYDSPLQAKHVTVHRSRLALVASDHLPIVADFVYDPPKDSN